MADALVVAADDRHEFHCAQQPPRSSAAARSNTPLPPVLFRNLDAANASDKEIWKRGFNRHVDTVFLDSQIHH